jgi:hypothetical protein
MSEGESQICPKEKQTNCLYAVKGLEQTHSAGSGRLTIQFQFLKPILPIITVFLEMDLLTEWNVTLMLKENINEPAHIFRCLTSKTKD